MRTAQDIERFLKESSISFQDFGDGLYVISDETSGLRNLAIKVEAPVVVFRLRVMDVPPAESQRREALFEQLLRLNGGAMLHSAFSLQEDGIYLTAALPLDNLDLNELQAVVDDMGMAISQHIPRLDVKHTN